MSTNIRFKRSDIPGKVPSLDSIDLGELALNTADGKLFTKQEIKQPDGFAAIQKIIEIGATEVPNVLYVAKNGDDSNSGKTLGQAFLTLKKALSIATPGTTIFLKSGEYIEDNPLRVPARVSVVGDNLRNTTVRPKNPTKDIFWVYNGAYIFCMNFKGHIAPSAAVCFPPDGSAGEIVTSPYTQAVTSITTTGTGMRVDGAVTTGLRSMVCDAFTQYNQGGIGIHMLNRGNTQLVSIFTICCDISFMCENGGFCSVNLSNSSFGNYGLVSRGASEPLYRGVVKKSAGRQITFKNLAKRPNIGDGVLFADYNQKTCDRDNGLIVDSLAFDLLYEGTTQSTFSGLRYWAKDDITTGIQQQEQTAAAIQRALIAARSVVMAQAFTSTGNNVTQNTTLPAGSETAKRIITDEFNIISRIVAEGPKSPSLIIGPDLDAAEPEYKVLRETVLDRKAQIADEAIDFLKKNYSSLAFVTSKCKRDIAFVIEAVVDDMILGTNYKTIKAAITYLTAVANTYTVASGQETATIEAYKFVRDKIVPIVQEDATLLARVQASFEIVTRALSPNNTNVNALGGKAFIQAIIDPTNTNAAIDDYRIKFPGQQDTEDAVLNLVKNLQANKPYIVAEVIDYINKNWPNIVAYNYNQETCGRDVGYAIDAICYDITYGGNSQTLDAAKRYFNYASGLSQLKSSEEVPATIDSFGRAQLLAQRVVILDPIEGGQSSVLQKFAVGTPSVDLVATTQTQVNKLGGLFSLFLKQLETEVVGTSDFIQPNGSRLDDAGLDRAYALLQANKQFIKNDVVNYLARAYPGFDYDKVKCARDIGFIIDSVCFDLVHGGNRQAVTAGIYYYDFNEETNVLKSVLPKQIKQTVNAYKYMKELLRDVLTCSPVPNPWQGAVPQRIDLPAATGSEVVAVGNLIDIINEILQEGPNNSEDSIQRLKQPIGLTASTDTNKVRAFNLLMANRDFIRAEMLAYININWYTISDGDTQFARVNTATDLALGTTTTAYPTTTYQPATYKAIRDAVLAAKEDIKTETIKFMANSFFDNFSFNKPKCYRDVGLILDAILSDMVFGSNYKTITAAISYLRAYASEVVGAQKVQTVASLKAAKAITLKRIVAPSAKEEISTRFDIVIDILDGARVNDLGQIITNAKVGGVSYSPDSGYSVSESASFGTDDGAITYPVPMRNNEEDIDRYTAVSILRKNYNFIKEEVVSYIDANFTLNQFDKEKCARDVGLIVDALGYDLMFVSNFRSISAGRSYLRANTAKVTGSQKLATLGSFKHLKKLAVELVKANSLAVNSVQRNMDIILEILDKGEDAVPKFMIPFPSSGRNIEYKRARDLVEKNRDFIIDDVITYINTPGLQLIPGEVVHKFVSSTTVNNVTVNTYRTDGTFAINYSDLNDTITLVAGDLVRISGKIFGLSTINGYSSPTVYKVATITNSNTPTRTVEFKLVNLDGSELVTYGGTTGKTTGMRFEKIKSAVDFPVPTGFDAAKCRRDLEYILDALFYDTTYGGTLESEVAGKSYVAGTLSQLDPTGTQSDEVTATLRAYTYLRSLVVSVAQDIEWTPTVGNTTLQVRSPNGSDGSLSAALDMETCVKLILKLIDDANDENLTTALTTISSTPDLSWVEPTLLNAHRSLQANKESTKDSVVQFVDDNYVLFGYDRAKCARDVGYVIDAVKYDMLFNSNVRSIVAGRSYYRQMASVVVKDQKSATLASFQHLKDKLLEIVKPAITGNPTNAETTSQLRVTRSMDIILSILENGLAVEPAFLVTDPTSGTGNAFVADRALLRNDIETNRTTIENSLISWINTNKASYGNPSYDENACRRDVEYILDALRYDLTYGGNLETRIAATAYYGKTSDVGLALGTGEKALTLAAYAQLKTIIDTNSTATDLTPVNNLIDIIRDYIDDTSITISAVGALTVGKNYRITSLTGTTNAQWNTAAGTSGVTYAVGDIFTAAVTAGTGTGTVVLDLAPAVAPSTTWTDSGIKVFFDKLGVAATVNKLKTSVTDFVDFNFAYNRDKCKRDVGFLIDALCYDLLYGGNVDTTQAAISYFDGAVTPKSIIPKQIIQTVAAYERLKEVLAEVVQLKDVKPTSKQFEAKQRVNSSFDLIIKLLKDGPNFTPKRPFAMPVPTSGAATAADVDYLNAVKLISGNRNFLVAEVTGFIKNINTQLNGALTTAATTITVDSTTGFPSAGKLVIGTEVVTYTGKTSTTFTGVARAQDGTIAGLYDVANSTPSVPVYTSWPDNTTVKLTFEYDLDKCERDVGFLLDAVLYDLTYGGNTASHLAGKAYYDGTVKVAGVDTPDSLSGELNQSIEAYKYLGDLLEVVAQGQSWATTIRNTKQNAVTQKFGQGDATGTAAAKAKNLLKLVVVPLIDGDGGTAATAIAAPGTSWVDSKLVALSDAINLTSFRDAVKAEVNTLLTTKFDISYAGTQKTQCEADIDDVIDSVRFDVMFGSNYRSQLAGNAYYRGFSGLTNVLGAQKDGSVATFELLRDAILEKVALYTIEQNKTGSAGDGPAGAAAADLIQVVIASIDNNVADPSEDPADTDWVDQDLVDLSDALVDSKTGANGQINVPALVTAYIDDRFQGALTYVQADCQEDIRSIIDAVRYDMMFNSNFRTISAARAYFRAVASKVIGEQKFATIEAFKFAKEKLSSIVSTNATALERVKDRMDLLINIVDKGEKAIPAYVLPSPTGYNTTRSGTVKFGFARNLIESNRDFIKSQVLKFLRTDPNLVDLDFVESTCARDLDLILDAVYYDMTYGGNMESIIAGGAYYRGTRAADLSAVGQNATLPDQDEIDATIDAFKKLKEYVELIAQGIDVSDIQVIFPQVTGEAGSVAGAQTAKNLAFVIRDFVRTGYKWKGTWSSTPTYAARDLVVFEGTFWTAKQTSKEQTPFVGSAYWSKENISTPDISWVEEDLKNANTMIELMKTDDDAATGYGGRNSIQSQITEWVRLQLDAARFNASPATITDPVAGPLREFGALSPGNDIVAVGDWKEWFVLVPVTSMVNGSTYKIADLGTNGTFPSSSGSNSAVGDEFVASGAGTGDGKVVKVLKASDMVAGRRYKIKTVGTPATTWTAYSTETFSATVDSTFIATGAPAAVANEGTVYEMFTYDIEKCERDVLLTLDAIRYDLMFGSSFRTSTVARSYWRQQSASALATGTTTNSVYPQTTQSARLFTFLKTILQRLPARYPNVLASQKGEGEIPGITSGGRPYNRITQLMDLLISVIQAPNLAAVNGLLPARKQLPLPVGGKNNANDLGVRKARDLIEANRDFLKAEVIDWIDEQQRQNREGFQNNPAGIYSTDFSFDRKQCSEDLDLVLDAIFYDLTYGGNMESYWAGQAYYAGTSQKSLPDDEIEATIRAYNYLGNLIFDVARSSLAKSYQKALQQVQGTAGSVETSQRLGELVDIVINVVKGGVKQVPPRVNPDFLAGDETLAYVRIAVQEQKQELQARIADYIDSFILQYNTEKCARDVGLILDAAMYDMVLNSNFQSITAGSVYLQKAANVVTSTQIGPQLQAIKFIRDRVIEISQKPPLVKNEAAIGRITNLFDVMFDIIDKGVEVAPPVVNVPPIGAAFNPNAVNAANSLIANKEFLKEEVVAYITANYKTYDQSRCSRDVGLIIDAALYDLLLGTNYNSVKAGLAYRRATSSLVITDQLQETLGGIDFAKQKVVELLDDADAIASITRSFELISSIIGGGSVPTARVPLPGGSVYALTRPAGIVNRDSSFKVAADAILVAKATLKTAVTTWIDTQQSNAAAGSIWSGFTYDSTKCQEDVGFLLDAVAYDLIYGGNMETMVAGKAYYDGTVFTNAGEIPATVAAYTYLSEQVLATVNTALNATTNTLAATEARDLVLQVRNLIESGAGAVATTVLPSQVWVNPLLQEVSQTFIQEKPRLQDVIIDYVNNINTFTSISAVDDYDKDKCRRDVGLVLDAIRYDLMFNTSFRTISAGRSYRRSFANVITGTQATANISAFKELKERVLGKKLVGVTITSTSGEFSCTAPVTDITQPIKKNQPIRVSGVYGTGAGTLENYTNISTQPKTYYVVGTPTTTSFQLSEEVDGTPIVTTLGTAGSTAGLTFEIRPSLESLDEVTTQGLLDVETLDAENALEPLVPGREYKITSTGKNLVQAGTFIVGGKYKIVYGTGSTTDFTSLGAADNNPGTIFTATGTGVGTGTAYYYTDYTAHGARNNTVGTVFVATSSPSSATGGSGSVQTISFRERAERLFDIFLAILASDNTALNNLGFNAAADSTPDKQGGSGSFKYYLITPPTLATTDFDTTAEYNAAVANQNSRIAARLAINNARQTIEDGLITFINTERTNQNGNFNGLVYTEATCRKDIKLILDAITYDLTFGGNQETIVAGKAYYDGTALPGDDRLATIDAYKQLKTLIAAQTAAGDGETAALKLVDDIISFIDQRIEEPVAVDADTSWVDSELYVFSDKLKAAANTVAKATTDYVNANFAGLVYDVDKCQRDVKLVIEAVRWDMMFNSNFRTIVAARSYYRAQAANVVGTQSNAAQREATQKAFEVVKVALDDIVKTDDLAKDRVAALMDIVINILKIDPTDTNTYANFAAAEAAALATLPAVSTPYGGTPNASDIGHLNARDRIEENRHFILEDMRSYLLSTVANGGLELTSGTSFGGNFTTDECLRDVGLILDAVRYDLTYGGNLETVLAAKAYYSGTVLGATPPNAAHITATKNAFARLATVVEKVAKNTVHTTINAVGGSANFAGPSQIVANDPGSTDAAEKASDLVNTIVSALTLVNANALVEGQKYVIIELGTGVNWTAMGGNATPAAGQTFVKNSTAYSGTGGTVLPDYLTQIYDVRPSTSWVDNNLALIASTMLDRKNSLALQVTDYVNAQFPGFSYTVETCQRDVKLVTEAVRYDMMFGTNFRSWTAGKSYYRNMTSTGVVTTTQKAATLAAFRFLKGLLVEIAGNNVTAALRVKGAMNVVIDVLEFGETTRNANNTVIRKAVDAIEANRADLLTYMGGWLDTNVTNNFGGNYSKTKCLRDLGYLIDAIKYDLTYGGNMETCVAGRSYYDGVVLEGVAGSGSTSADHIDKTQAAFTALGNRIKTYSDVDQYMVDPMIDALINNVNALIDDDSLDTEVYADASWSEVTMQEVSVAIRSQTDAIKTQVTNYVDTNFPALVYNKTKCARDVGLLIDAVRWDMLFNSNFRSITAGRSYYRLVTQGADLNLAADALASLNQKQATVAAFTYLKEVLMGIAASNAISKERITDNMDIILQIIETGLGDQATPTITYSGVSNVEREKANAILLANKTFIKNEVIAYINDTYTKISYDEALCARDVEFLTYAVAYDMVTGSNYHTVTAARSYLRQYASNVLTDQQKHITLLAFKYLKNLLINYVGGNADAVASIKASMDIIITTINAESVAGLPAVVVPTANVTTTAGQVALNTWLLDATNIAAAKAAGITASGNSGGGSAADCNRDIGYVLEALTHDITYGGNWASIIAAKAYRDGTGTIQLTSAGEEAATIAAFNGVRDYIINNSSAPADLDARVTALIAIITGVVNSATYTVPAVEYPELLGSRNALEAARNILISNVANAKAKTIRWVNNRSYFVYEVQKCERDIGLILDAVFTDMVTGSNFLSVQAGRSYLRASASDVLASAQKWAILAGLTQAKSIVSSVISTNADAISAVRAKLSVVIDVINDETDANVAISYPINTTTASSNTSRQDASADIVSNKGTLVSGVISGLSLSAGAQTDNCTRDLNYVVDALAHDILYGGNWGVTVAAKSYYIGTATINLGSGEKAATKTAFESLGTAIKGLTDVDATADGYVDTLIAIITSVLDTENDATNAAQADALTITAPSTAGGATNLVSGFTALVASKEATQFKIFEYINSREYLDYTGTTVTKCERDVDLILDALAADIPAASNYKSIKAAQAYLRSYSKIVTSEQKQATIGSLYLIKRIVSQSTTGSVKTDARTLMDTIIDIVDRGVIATPALVITTTAATDPRAVDDTLVSYSNFIKAEVRAYLDRNYPELDYNKIKCERDVQYIIDALRYDMAYGGNAETIEAALSYWEGNQLTLGSHPDNIDDIDITGGEDEKVATIAAYQFLADLVGIILNNSAYTPLQDVVSKGTHTTGAASKASDAEAAVDSLVLVVNNPLSTLASAETVANNQRTASSITVNTTINTLKTTVALANGVTASASSMKANVSFDILRAFVNTLGDATQATGSTVQFFVYNEAKCGRDVEFIVEALAFDALYGGNKESRTAALEYAYKGGLMIPLATKGPTVGGFKHLKNLVDLVVAGTAITNVNVTGFTGTTGQVKAGDTVGAGPDTWAGSSLTGVSDLVQITLDVIKGGAAAAPALVDPVFADVDNFKPDNLIVRAIVRDSIPTIAENTITFINETYAGFGYLQDTCKRDVGLTIDALAYDLIYGGNSRTKFAAEQYYSGGRFQIPADSKSATVACFVYLDALARKVVLNDAIVTAQNYVDQDKSNPKATAGEVTNITLLMDAFTDILTNGYISVLQLDATFNGSVDDNTYATFHQVSTITTTGHTLEWVGTGIDVDSALPYNGGVPKPENQLVSDKGGFINFTSTDEKGDFRIGPDLTIKRDSGSIVGRAFNKSLLGVVTPYILALQS